MFPPPQSSQTVQLAGPSQDSAGKPAYQGAGALSSTPPPSPTCLGLYGSPRAWYAKTALVTHRTALISAPLLGWGITKYTIPRSRLGWRSDLSRKRKKAPAGRAGPPLDRRPPPPHTGPAWRGGRRGGGCAGAETSPLPGAGSGRRAARSRTALDFDPGEPRPCGDKARPDRCHLPHPAGGRGRAAAPARRPPPSRRRSTSPPSGGRLRPERAPPLPLPTRRARETPPGQPAPLPPPRLSAAATHRVEQVEGAEAVLGAGEAPAHHDAAGAAAAAAAAGEPHSRRPPPRPRPAGHQQAGAAAAGERRSPSAAAPADWPLPGAKVKICKRGGGGGGRGAAGGAARRPRHPLSAGTGGLGFAPASPQGARPASRSAFDRGRRRPRVPFFPLRRSEGRRGLALRLPRPGAVERGQPAGSWPPPPGGPGLGSGSGPGSAAAGAVRARGRVVVPGRRALPAGWAGERDACCRLTRGRLEEARRLLGHFVV